MILLQLVDMMEWSPNDSVLAAQLNSTNGAAAGVLKVCSIANMFDISAIVI